MRRVSVLVVMVMALLAFGCTEDAPGDGNSNGDEESDADQSDASDADQDDGGDDAGDDGDAGDTGGEDGGEDAGDADDGGNDADDGGELDVGDDGGDTDGGDTGEEVELSIEALDQFLAAADSNRVVVDSAVSDGAGWAVIHEDDEGDPGDILGQAQVDDGENEDIEVELNRDVADGETLYAMLHVDAGEEGTFEPDEDEPALDDNDEPVIDEFLVDLPSVETETELVDDLSTVIPVRSVVSKGDGWIVIHEGRCTDDNGDPAFGAALGHASVSDGQNDDVEVAIARPAADDEDFCAMLHLDDPDDDDFTYQGGEQDPDDPPAALADSEEIIMESFSVQIPGGTPAVRITIDNDGIDDYTFDDVEPSIHDDGMEGNNDPDLVLYQGWRYEIVNDATTEHPFEFMRQGFGGQEVVVFSQHETGQGESDTNADWDESGNAMLFTVSGTYFTEGVGNRPVEWYECHYHHEEMTGEIDIQQP